MSCQFYYLWVHSNSPIIRSATAFRLDEKRKISTIKSGEQQSRILRNNLRAINLELRNGAYEINIDFPFITLEFRSFCILSKVRRNQERTGDIEPGVKRSIKYIILSILNGRSVRMPESAYHCQTVYFRLQIYYNRIIKSCPKQTITHKFNLKLS